MKIVWSPTARTRIDEIVGHISENNVDAAFTLVEEFENTVQSLKKHPRLGRISPVLHDESIRELVVRENYVIVYELYRNQILILTIRHARQDFDESDLNSN